MGWNINWCRISHQNKLKLVQQKRFRLATEHPDRRVNRLAFPDLTSNHGLKWADYGNPFATPPKKNSKMYCKNAILAVPSSWWLRFPNELYTVYYRHHNKSPYFFEVIIWDQLQIPMGSSELRTKSPPTWLVSQPPREKASAFLVNWWRKVVLNQLLMATNEDPNVYTACTIYIYLLYSIFPRSCIYNTEF